MFPETARDSSTSLGMTRRCTRTVNSYTHLLTKDQARKLRSLLDDLGFQFAPKPYTLFFAQKNKLSVAVYEKGPKVLLQGKGIEEFVQFELEPKILEEAKLGYEEVHSPEMFEPHFGIDESGKGDFFGPLVIAGVYVDHAVARTFLDAGIQDSKRIGSDARIRALTKVIRTTACSAGGMRASLRICSRKNRNVPARCRINLQTRALSRKRSCNMGRRFASSSGRKRNPISPWPRLPFWRAKLSSIGWTAAEKPSGQSWGAGFPRK